MTDLTEQWKNGKIEILEELINQIATVNDSRSFSDEYLKEKGLMTREECGVAVEYTYGIVMVVSDYVLPYLKKLQVIEEENKNLYKMLDVLNRHLDSFLKEEENQRLKELLKECQHMIIAYSINHDTFSKEKINDIVKQIDNITGEKK